jgi:uncharacterized membrane protein
MNFIIIVITAVIFTLNNEGNNTTKIYSEILMQQRLNVVPRSIDEKRNSVFASLKVTVKPLRLRLYPGKYNEVHNSFCYYTQTENNEVQCQMIAQRAPARLSVQGYCLYLVTDHDCWSCR